MLLHLSSYFIYSQSSILYVHMFINDRTTRPSESDLHFISPFKTSSKPCNKHPVKMRIKTRQVKACMRAYWAPCSLVATCLMLVFFHYGKLQYYVLKHIQKLTIFLWTPKTQTALTFAPSNFVSLILLLYPMQSINK